MAVACAGGVKLLDNPLERIGIGGVLLAFVDGATLFLERPTNDNEPGLKEDVFREKCRLLHALSFELTTPTVQSGLTSCSSEQIP